MRRAKRFTDAPDVLRTRSPPTLRLAFRRDVQRRQRQSDGTISLDGVRFEIPSRYRHFRDVVVRYPRWDLSLVDLVDPRRAPSWRDSFPWIVPPMRTVAPPLEPQPGRSRPASHGNHLPNCHRCCGKSWPRISATGLPPAYLPKNARRSRPRKDVA